MVNSVVFSKSDNADIRRVVYVTGNFVLGQDVAKPIVKRFVIPMPYDSKVEYLANPVNPNSTNRGGGLINTGIKPKADSFSFELEFSFDSNSLLSYYGIFGCRKQASVTDSTSYNALIDQGRIRLFTIGESKSDGSQYPYTYKVTPLEKIIYKYTPSTTEVNGIVYANVQKSDCNQDFILFNFRSQSGLYGSPPRGCPYMRIYHCKIWNNNTLVRDLIPVRVGNIGYMYDRVSEKLFRNSGTGNFILGNDIN